MKIPYSNEWQTIDSAKELKEELKKNPDYKRVFLRGSLDENGKTYTKVYIERYTDKEKLINHLKEVL